MEGMKPNNTHQVQQSPQPPQADQVGGQQVGGQQFESAGGGGHSQPPQPPRWFEPSLESKTVVIIIMLAAITVLLSFLVGIFTQFTGKTTDFVNHDQYQAVFLTNGQVYFGNITGYANDTMLLENIYYLQVDEQIQPETGDARTDPQVSLAKLGNELHGPEDQMFINNNEVIFWENLREDGEVSQAIEQFEQGEGQAEMEGNDTQRIEDHEDTEANEETVPENFEDELEE